MNHDQFSSDLASLDAAIRRAAVVANYVLEPGKLTDMSEQLRAMIFKLAGLPQSPTVELQAKVMRPIYPPSSGVLYDEVVRLAAAKGIRISA